MLFVRLRLCIVADFKLSVAGHALDKNNQKIIPVLTSDATSVPGIFLFNHVQLQDGVDWIGPNLFQIDHDIIIS